MGSEVSSTGERVLGVSGNSNLAIGYFWQRVCQSMILVTATI
ncbi:hypothetical protein [Chamaesiphon polymorphus]|nr:hypothetical protein [Chamaesiphon polymorphus]